MLQKTDFVKKVKLFSTSKPTIKLDENLEFTIKYENAINRFHIEDVKGDLEITKITATADDDESELDVIYDQLNNTFGWVYGNGDEYTFYITANIEMKEVKIKTESIFVNAERLRLLSTNQFFKDFFILLELDGDLRFPYYVKKIKINDFSKNDIEVHLENPYDVQINGKKGDYKIQLQSSKHVDLNLTFVYDPSITKKPFSTSTEKTCFCNSPAAKNAIDDKHNTAPDESRPPSADPEKMKLFKMLSNECYADAFLISSDQLKLPTHRCILAEFSTIFAEIILQSKELPITINIEDFNGETIQAALDFLHGKHESINGKEMDVFKFAIKYKIQNIIGACCTFFEESVAPSNVCEFIQIAYSNNFEELKQKCLKILVESKKEIDSSKFAKLPENILSDFFKFF